ncbi:MAG: tetratricopeptide repeat protein [Phycisphaerae bacterium]|jgi:tetratricopeptide (TPR) repeat protein
MTIALPACCLLAACNTEGEATKHAPPPAASRPTRRVAVREKWQQRMAELDARVRERPSDVEALIERGILRRKLAGVGPWEKREEGYAWAWADFRAAHQAAGGEWTFGELLSGEESDKSPPLPGVPFAARPGGMSGSARALVEAAIIYINHGMRQRAAPLLNAAERIAPDDPHVKAERLLFDAEQSRDWAAAADGLRALVSRPESSRDGSLWSMLGIALARSNDPAGAVGAAQRAIELDDSDLTAYQAMFMQLRGMHQPGEAIKWIEPVLELFESHPQLTNDYALAIADCGRVEEAADVLRKLVERMPDFPAGWLNLGNMLSETRQFERAAEAYQRAAELIPGAAVAWSRAGRAWMDAGQLEKATAATERAFALAPDDSEVLYKRGALLLRQGRFDDALDNYRRLARVDGSADAYNELGRTLMVLERYAEARRAFDAALQIQADCAPARFNLAVVELTSGDPCKAVPILQKLREEKPHADDIADRLVQSLENCGQVGEALALADARVREQPDSPIGYRWRMYAHIHSKAWADALRDIDEANRRAPDAELRLERAFILCVQGDCQAALAEARKAIDANPTHAAGALLLWRIEHACGKADAGRRAVQIAAKGTDRRMWFAKLVRYYADELSQDEILAAAETDRMRCEAYYYIGEKIRVQRGPAEAREWYERCVALGIEYYWEHTLAQARLVEK